MANNEINCPSKINNIRESEVQFIEERINLVKDFHACLCYNFASYIRKIGCIRDKGDKLTKLIVMYSDSEPFHQSMKYNLMQFASVLSAIQDCRQERIDCLEQKVVSILMKHGDSCKSAKADVKNTLRSKKRKNKLIQWLVKLKSKSAGDNKIAEGKLFKASAEASKNIKAIKELILEFECRKLMDLKRIIFNFVKTEMLFHSKALELYTTMLATGKNIDVKCDMTEFCKFVTTQSQIWQTVNREINAENCSTNDESTSTECIKKITEEDITCSDNEEFIALVESFCSKYSKKKNMSGKNKFPFGVGKQNLQNHSDETNSTTDIIASMSSLE